eukprot:TRINITY_DN6066_c0_g1_i10.p1 TRINITY_DN6066_c0_g1~~TRINITY_DN6066_c0_g1_i10.p1  ORF type:complete len:102 (+),score=11.61 TRINITY_DN6066_c0_g1_i10:153-458(+)
MPQVSEFHKLNQDEGYLVMDALEQGNVARFINHSCDPNLVKQTILVPGKSFLNFKIAFFAQKFIKAGTELCYDYSWKLMAGEMNGQIQCQCGAENCRGQLL